MHDILLENVREDEKEDKRMGQDYHRAQAPLSWLAQLTSQVREK